MVSGEPHEPQGEGIDGRLCRPLIGGCPALPQTFEYEAFDIVGETGGSQLALVPSVVLGHHDEGRPKIVKNGRGVDVGSPDVF
jgi:hypothetical protein